MKASAVLALAIGAQFATAHTTVWNVLVNGKDQGVGNTQGGYVDSPPNNNPITNVESQDMTCNVANIKASTQVPVNGGDEITVQWHHNNNQASDDIIDPTHKGPVMVYISKAGSSLSWTKIWEDGWDGKSWAVTKLQTGAYTGTPGQHKVTLPNLAPGDYILRPEIVALHEGDRLNGAQFYMECVHLKVGGSGAAALPAGVSIPGAYKATDAGIFFNLYGSFTSYPIPGPSVWDGASSGTSAAPATSQAPTATQASVAKVSTTVQAPTTTQAAPTTQAPTTTKASTTTKAPVATAKPTTTTIVTVAKPTSTTTLVTVAKPTATAGGAAAQKYGQCGGLSYTGPNACPSGWTCKVQNSYYSQCVQ